MGIKRLVVSIGASFEELVNRVENHEAVAEVAIGKVQQAAAKLHVQAQQVARRRDHQRRQQSELTAQCQTWRRRALRLGEQDQDKALACLRALKKCEAQLARVDEQVQQSDQLLAELDSHLQDAQSRLHNLQARKASLSARAWRSKAATYSLDAMGNGDAEALFNRWESAVCADEYGAAIDVPASAPLERELRESEDYEQLQAELKLLLQQSQREAQ